MKEIRMTNTAEDFFAEVTIHTDLFPEETSKVSIEDRDVTVSFNDETFFVHKANSTVNAQRVVEDIEVVLMVRQTVTKKVKSC